MTDALRGLTWDHPRAYTALDELTRLDLAGESPFGEVPRPLVWERQPLSGFESAPIADLAKRHDVLVIDHPGVADAVAADALLPVEETYPSAWLDQVRRATVGPSYDSYDYRGSQWALPLDVASQVGAMRAGLVGADDRPGTWQEAAQLVREVPAALCLGGPHALLMLLALCVTQGDVPCRDEGFASTEILVNGLDLMAELLVHADREVSRSNPIGVLDAMAGGAIGYCPLVYGYVTYSQLTDGRVAFHDAPAWYPGGTLGSVLGGTGLAVSAHCTDLAAARAHIARLVNTGTQVSHIPRYGGQPAARPAWLDPTVDEQAHGFYAATIRTVEQAWVRPRRRGFVAFCDRTSGLVRDGLFEGVPVHQLATQVQTAYRDYCRNEVHR